MKAGHSVLAVVSPKGGVGKTTVSANLTAAIAQSGRPCLLIDLDAQNAARLHFRMPYDAAMGLAVQALQGLRLRPAIYRSEFGVDVLPYGLVSEPDRREFEDILAADPGWLRHAIEELELQPGTMVVIDTPPGASSMLHQALAAADFALMVLLPDAASYATVPSMERWLAEASAARGEFQGGAYLVNRMNGARLLCRDVLAALQQLLGDRLLHQQIHFDAAVEEALACHMPLIHYAPDTLAVRDIAAVADWLVARL
jgi:chromosome partitioning protein